MSHLSRAETAIDGSLIWQSWK